MINLETPQFSVILGAEELKRQAPDQAVAAALIISSFPLSDEEATTAFALLSPSEARVDKSLLEIVSKTPVVVEALGLRFALVRWKEDTESIVGFPVNDTVPSPALLLSAYRNGYSARRLKTLLAKRAEERGHA